MNTWLRSMTRISGVAALLFASGCQAADRAGGDAGTDVTVLVLAQPNHSAPEQLVAFAEQVEDASSGSLKIEFRDLWREGQLDFEAGTIADVRAGKADMAWVGARAFDKVGLTSFQPLVAPLVVDSHAVQQAVFESGVVDEMVEDIEEIGLVGIGALPGPMFKLLSRGVPITRPAALRGKTVGIQNSALMEETFAALDAKTSLMPTGADITHVDAYAQQLSSIWGNHYEEEGATSVAGNLNLWPRPLVVVMNPATYQSLDEAQRDALTRAMDAAFLPALEASRAEDEESVESICKAGVAMPTLSAGDLAAWTRSVEPVLDTIAVDHENAERLDRIREIKATVSQPPDGATCSEAIPAKGVLDGTYEVTLTDADWATAGLEADGYYEFTLTFDGDTVTLREYDGKIGYSAPYDIFKNRFHTTNGEDDITATIEITGDRLTFSEIVTADCKDCRGPYHVVWGSHPWVRVQS